MSRGGFIGSGEETRYATSAEIVLTRSDGDQDLVRDGALRNPELRGDFFLGEPFKFVEDDDFITTGGQCRHRLGEQIVFFLQAEFFGGVRCLIYNARSLQTTQRVERRGFAAAKKIDRDIARCLEQKCLRRRDGFSRMPPPNAQIGLLHHIIHLIADSRESSVQPRLELLTVRMHFGCEPLGVVLRRTDRCGI